MPLPWSGIPFSGPGISGKVRRISGTAGSAQRVDVTGLADNERDYVPGIAEDGELTFEIVSDNANLSLPSEGATGTCTVGSISWPCMITGVDLNVGVGDAPVVTVKVAAIAS
jgi:hypothetical protein